MSAPDPESMSLTAKVLGALAAIGTPIWLARNWLEARFSKKANRDELDKCLRHIEKLYENAEQDRATTRDLCDKLREQMDENHRHLVGIFLGNRNGP